MSDVPGALDQALAGHYRLEREVGAGGMATVYLAEDLKHHRKVAVKVLKPELAATLGPERFLREIEIAARLHHPHILPLYDSGQASGFLYYVMPYVEGESLRARLARERELPIPEAVRIVREIVDALAYAHAQGIVHRDIKPENVLLSGRHAMVTDFGVAKAVSEATGRQKLTTAGVTLGTPVYMAPEQAAADPHMDHRADIYAVGVVAYELLAGQPPFTGPSPQAILAAHVTQPAEPVTKHRAHVPEALTQLVVRCLEKKAADRFQKAEEMLPVLETLQTPSGGITPTHTQPVAAAAKPARRRRWWIPAAALVLLAAAGAAGLLWRSRHGVDPNRRLVVVPPFENRTGDTSLNELGELAANWVADALVRDGTADAVSSTIVQDLLRGDLHASSKPAEDLARRTGARIAVVGEYHRRGDQVEFRGALVAMPGAKTLVALDPVVGASGGTALLAALELRVLEAVHSQLELGGSDPHSYSRPSNVEAYREYARGQEFFARSENERAVEHYSRAVALDTAWTSPLVDLSASFYNLGQRLKADSVLRMAERRRNALPPGEADRVDWLRAWLSGDKAMEYRTARRSFDRSPRTFAYVLAVTANRTNRSREVVRAAVFRDTSTAWGREWFAWYSVEASALHLLDEHRKELEVALQRRRRFPVEAGGLNLEIAARAAMGQLDEVTRLLDQATGKTGWGGGPGLAYAEFLAHGHDEAARALLMRALSTYEGFATQTGASRADSIAFATALFAARDYRRSREWWQRLASARDTSGTAQRNLTYLAALEGDRERAMRESQQWTVNPPPFSPGEVSYRRALVAACLGDRSRAIQLLRQAFAEGRPFGVGYHRELLLQSIWNEPGFRDLMRPKD